MKKTIIIFALFAFACEPKKQPEEYSKELDRKVAVVDAYYDQLQNHMNEGLTLAEAKAFQDTITKVHVTSKKQRNKIKRYIIKNY